MNSKAEYTDCTFEQDHRIHQIRQKFSDMYDAVESLCKPGRETSLAMTKLEEAQFWAIKGISREKADE